MPVPARRRDRGPRRRTVSTSSRPTERNADGAQASAVCRRAGARADREAPPGAIDSPPSLRTGSPRTVRATKSPASPVRGDSRGRRRRHLLAGRDTRPCGCAPRRSLHVLRLGGGHDQRQQVLRARRRRSRAARRDDVARRERQLAADARDLRLAGGEDVAGLDVVDASRAPTRPRRSRCWTRGHRC